jgi:hypothetical protein
MVGRALRTQHWTYAVRSAPDLPPGRTPSADRYIEYQMYDLFADPHQLVNMAGRRESRQAASHLRERLQTRMVEAGRPKAEIEETTFYP